MNEQSQHWLTPWYRMILSVFTIPLFYENHNDR